MTQRPLALLSFSALFSLTACPGRGSIPDQPLPMDVATSDASGDGATAPDGRTGDGGDAGPRNILETVPLGHTLDMPGLSSEVQVLFVEHHVPYLYASNRLDLARVHGFIAARDRFFFMDLARRQGLGTLSDLLGDAALSRDLDSRITGTTYVTARVLEQMTPQQLEFIDAYAAGINFYIEQVRLHPTLAPSELATAATLLFGGVPVTDLMKPFTRQDVAGLLTTIIYNLGFETADAERAAFLAEQPTSFTGQPLAQLRRDGALTDAFHRWTPIHGTASGAGWGLETAAGPAPNNPSPIAPAPPSRRSPGAPGSPRGTAAPLHISPDLLRRTAASLNTLQLRLHRVEGFGSNSWAVSGAHTTDGSGILSGDGHLPLSVPALFYQIGFDTTVLGGGDFSQIGLIIPGVPMMAVGTNGHVAWSQTQLGGDISDWYREELRIGADGLPSDSMFQGTWRPLVRTDEAFTIADVPALSSVGRTDHWARFQLFDGRMLANIEGRPVTRTEALNAGETRVWVLGGFVVPSDMDHDGVITALSYDHPALDGGNLLQALDGFGTAHNVAEFRQATRGLVAYSQNLVVADSAGDILYTSYQTVPCRNYLRQSGTTGPWQANGDPGNVLDGTRFGGFTIPLANGLVDEAPGQTDPYRCVVPFERTPGSLSPARGYVLSANNDTGGQAVDGNLTDEPFYTGGPWIEDYRAHRIDVRLGPIAAAHTASVETMSGVQGDHRSAIGPEFLPALLDSITTAQTLAAGPAPAAGTTEARMVALYNGRADEMTEVLRRLQAWSAADFPTPSGVETFYSTPAPGDGPNSVATTIFNSWMGRFYQGVFSDEPWPTATWSFDGNGAMVRTLLLMLNSRGTNRDNLASYNTATGESAYFDTISTAPIETSRELMLSTLIVALDYLHAAPEGPGQGGYGTADMNQWIWGYRHWVHFDSLLNDVLGSDPMFAPLVTQFSITPQRNLPLMPGLAAGDPRLTLPGFPRPSDHWLIDAGNSGLDGHGFDYGSGPNFRMVIALHGNQTRGVNILPGGQSGLNSSPNFADQAALWLGNQTMPMRLYPPEVVRAAQSREWFRPAQ